MRKRELPNLVYRAFKVDADGRAKRLGEVLADNHSDAAMRAVEQFQSSYGGLAVVFIGKREREAA